MIYYREFVFLFDDIILQVNVTYVCISTVRPHNIRKQHAVWFQNSNLFACEYVLSPMKVVPVCPPLNAPCTSHRAALEAGGSVYNSSEKFSPKFFHCHFAERTSSAIAKAAWLYSVGSP